MKDLQSQFETIFLSLGGTKDQAKILSSQLPDLADYQVNGALSLSKALKENPRKIAEDIINKIKTESAHLSVAGPGFINIKMKDNAILSSLDIKVKKKDKILIDYSSPNVAKSMHVGHLRSTLIGAALYSMNKIAGSLVVGDNHLGDWGTPMGIVLTKIQEVDNFSWDLKDIEKLYVQGSVEYKTQEDFKIKVQANTYSLQLKKDPLYSLWKKLVQTTKDSLQKDYDALGVKFDLWEGESSFEPVIPLMMKELGEKGLLSSSEGATVLPLSGENPLVLEKAAGGFLYATTDLACLKSRTGLYDKILYVVDKRQSLHFSQVFESAKKAGYDQGIHVSFGTINGSDGKPFKTRSGEVLKLQDLINEAKEKALQKIEELNPELPLEDKKNISSLVGVGALKFAELKHNRDTDYAFDIDKFVALEGFTGPYVMYQVLRAKSVLKKSSKPGSLNYEAVLSPEERKLSVLLSNTSSVMVSALESNMPHYLCEHLYNLCQAFSSFYAATPILKASEDKKDHYLALVKTFEVHGEYLFKALNIELPEFM